MLVYVWKNKAYIPARGKTQDGIRLALPPIYICDLSVNQLASSLQVELNKDEVELPRLHYKEAEQKAKPVLETIGVKRRAEVARRVHTYSLTLEQDKVVLDQTLRHGLQRESLIYPREGYSSKMLIFR